MATGPWEAWVGRSETAADTVRPFSAAGLAATLDRPAAAVPEGAEVMPLVLWLCFLPVVPMSGLGPDGHPARGGFLPPVPLPRRMWAGSRCRFHGPLRVGDRVERTSTIARIEAKTGKAGEMVFVTVDHVVRVAGRPVMEEAQDIVYVALPDRWVPPPATPLPQADWSEPVAVDAVRLFRFSALTFNAHRIHYDRRYAAEVERYPGLVVHGPLQAVLLFDAALRRAEGRRPARFEFRGQRPLFDHDAISLNGRARADGGLDLWTAAEGGVAMQAAVHWA